MKYDYIFRSLLDDIANSWLISSTFVELPFDYQCEAK